MAIHVINLPDFLRRQFHPLNPPPAGDRLATSLAALFCPNHTNGYKKSGMLPIVARLIAGYFELDRNLFEHRKIEGHFPYFKN
ncbi:MAG: hypothetical protein HKUEN01_05190 [Candidatus Kuenenia stuttgartiensis]|uniref:hypothetical protein n=1 Tax=Kuenenia stuttgartiensis TaxID=174633 RepID=UPI000C07E81A|nr:hypothetical protein [Candidatus Kuenenia stuttgartiensis]GJQ48133.1 MAG: hypothetical protein HKUEN01_05190 [Candidatus Kuenenia stuttgartiensis]